MNTFGVLESISKYRKIFFSTLEKKGLVVYFTNELYHFSADEKKISLDIPADLLITSHEKITAIILSKLNLNKRVFARSCEINRVDKKKAADFLNTYHLLGEAAAATHLGLFYKKELLALASFSKGRKMNRLSADLRSFELIRFCTVSGITVTGGLSRLLNYFCKEKRAGDIMTYIDKQFSNGEAYKKAGFKVVSETGELQYFIHKKDQGRRMRLKENASPEDYYKVSGPGNIKMIYTCNE